MELSAKEITFFQKYIWDFYKKNKRDLPWRRTTHPYRILVSEIMLQQTQVVRVREKYREFLTAFPNFKTLARASVSDVVRVWQGLGYNRRSLALRAIAKKVMTHHGGKLPNNPEILETFPGIGSATAGSICAFAYNIPTVFIETNIRRVFLHHFFSGKSGISDEEILKLMKQTFPNASPREWYWALMDYGSHLGGVAVNPNRKSRGYRIQSKFRGSHREMRGAIVRLAAQKKKIREKDMESLFRREDTRIHTSFAQLVKEGFLQKKKNYYHLIHHGSKKT